MENALLVTVSRQVALRREMDVIANNIANVQTNGFKRRTAEFREYLAPVAREDNFRSSDRRVSFVVDQRSPLDMRGGATEYTGNPLDIAIKGEGLIAVQAAQGERYTRNGAMTLDGTGQLVTTDGYPVLGEQGPFQFTNDDTDIKVAPDGTVSSSRGVRGRIRIVGYDSPQSLRNEGNNLFSSAVPLNPAPRVRVASGFVERSNVQSVVEISRMIEVTRAYQQLAGTLSRADELRRTAISRLSETA